MIFIIYLNTIFCYLICFSRETILKDHSVDDDASPVLINNLVFEKVLLTQIRVSFYTTLTEDFFRRLAVAHLELAPSTLPPLNKSRDLK